eukprot:scaffold13309_cov65-Phaeocystis_antarctica.AAC.3
MPRPSPAVPRRDEPPDAVRLVRQSVSVLVKVPGVGVVAARVDDLQGGVAAKELDQELSGRRVDSSIDGVAAQAAHAGLRVGEAGLERAVDIHRGQAV